MTLRLRCPQTRRGRGGAVLGLVLRVEHAASLRLGELRAGGRQDLLRPELVQPGPGQRVLRHHILPPLLRRALLRHHGVVLATPVDAAPGEWQVTGAAGRSGRG